MLMDSRTLPHGALIVVLPIVAVNLLDAFLTLGTIELGAVELNPFRRSLQEQGPLVFVAGKHFIVGACTVGVAAQCRRRLVLGALRFVLPPVYASIVIYQVALLGAA